MMRLLRRVGPLLDARLVDSHPAWNDSPARPNHLSDGARIRGEAATSAAPQGPPVDVTDARNAPGEPGTGRRPEESFRGSRRPGTGAACCWRAATMPEARAGDHQGATLHYSYPTLVRGDPPCCASSATPPVPATA